VQCYEDTIYYISSSMVMGFARSCEPSELDPPEALGGFVPPFGEVPFTDIDRGALATRVTLADLGLESDTVLYAYSSLRRVSLSSSTVSRC
jgi:hypothetical protein